MARILVLYGTSEGQTAKIARAIAMRLRADDIDADVVQAGTVDARPSDYSGVIVAASMHVGGYQKAIARWLRAHVTELADKPTAFVSVCLSVISKREKDRDEARAIPRRFVDELGWHPTLIKVVAGALAYSKYNFLTKWIMKRIAAAESGDIDTSRDYEYTDWKDLREFTDRFAALAAPATVRHAVAS